MNDFRDVLGIQEPKQRIKKEKGKKEKEKKKAVIGKLGKRNRLGREVKGLQSNMLGADLEEEEEAPLASVFGSMKKKAKVTKKVAPWTKWSYQSREDGKGVTLTHVRPRSDINKEKNAFLKLNIPFEMLKYDDEQYNRLLVSEDWTREETDQLMELCEMFDGRFIVVFDRWKDINKKRSLEDIKYRWFEVQGALEGGKVPFVFDVDYEKKRKHHAEILYNRNGHEVWEEFEAKKAIEPINAELEKSKAANVRMKTLLSALEIGVKEYTAAHTSKAATKHDAWSPKVVSSSYVSKKKNAKNATIKKNS